MGREEKVEEGRRVKEVRWEMEEKRVGWLRSERAREMVSERREEREGGTCKRETNRCRLKLSDEWNEYSLFQLMPRLI